ncbi:MAG: winged helix-turn-helix domain-containing protein [Gammaproteobacteria bacterium]|nr:winged helix-turn-helix domain-containing protein [Gammaproteobacteria bacterium]
MSEKSLSEATSFQVAGYRVEPSLLRVYGDGSEARLEAKAMQVLMHLVEHPGRVVSRAELEQQLWPGRIVTEDAVTNAVAKLRRAFGDDAHHPRFIETVPKSGYRLVAEVTQTAPDDDQASPATDQTTANGRQRWRPGLAWVAGALSVLLLLLAATAFLELNGTGKRTGPPLADKPAVAVLPFENLGTRPEQDYFANGITADLITALSKVEGLLVIAPGSVFAYKDTEAQPGQISRELDVDYVVVGNVNRLGDHLRINVQLMETSVERALWGERYSGVMDDVFSIQDRLVSAVIAALQVQLAPAVRASLSRRPTASVAAYDHYLRGLEDIGSRAETRNLAARNQFRKAIALDPAFARAYTALALTYTREAIDGWTATPSVSLAQAEELMEEAFRIDSGLPQVYFVRSQIDLFRRRHLSAIEAAEHAIRIDPNYADAYALSAWILSYAGRPGEAAAALDKAMRLNPRPPASYFEVLGEIQFVQARYRESSATFQRILDINPEYARARMWNAAALVRAGLTDKAEWEAAELLVASPDFALKRMEFAFPFKDQRTLESLLDGLKKAGLPE